MKTLLLVVGFPVIFSYLLTFATKQKIVQLLPLPFLFSIFWLFIFSVNDALKFGIQTLFFLFISLTIFLMYFFRYEILKFENIKSLIAPSVLIFVALGIWSYQHSSSMRFYDWDEFSYWGTAVKALFLFDQVSPYAPESIAFPEYLPGAPLFPYLVSEINGVWSEGRVYWSYQIITLTLFVSLLSNQTWRNWKKLIFTALSLLIVFTFFFNTFQTVYADPLLTVLFGYLIYLGVSNSIIENKTYLINFVFVATYLSLLKDIGIFFAFIGTFLAATNFYLQKNKEIGKLKGFFISCIAILFALSPTLIFKFVWSQLLEQQGIKTERSIVNVISKLILNPAETDVQPYWKIVIANFYEKTINDPLTTTHSLALSSFEWLLILIFLCTFLAFVNHNKKEKLKDLWITFLLVTGFFGYLLVLLLSYLTVFSEGEAIGLASFNRYVSTFLAGILIYISVKILDSINETPGKLEFKGITFVWIFLLIFQSNPANVLTYITNPNFQGDAWRNPFSDRSWLIAEVNLPPESKVWIIAQHTVGFEFYLLQYELLPANVGKIPWSIGSLSGPGDIWTDSTYDKGKWNQALNDYDYVFINNVTESFIAEFGTMFEDPSTLDKPGIYIIEHSSDGNRLVKLR